MKTLSLILAALLLAACSSKSQRFGIYTGVARPVPSVRVSVVSGEQNVDRLPIPNALTQLMITFPLEMKRAGIAGEVLASVTVEKDGSVSGVSLTRATAAEFGDPAATGLKKGSFIPAYRDGTAVRSVVQCKVEFILEDG